MNRKYINYAIFIAIVAVVVGLAVSHSRHMRYLVDSMAGGDPKARIASARELVKAEQFMDAVTGEPTETRVKVVQALEDWAASGEPTKPIDPSDKTKTIGSKSAVAQLVAFLKDPDKPVRDRILLALVRVATRTPDNLQEVVNGIKDGDVNVRKATVQALQVVGQKTAGDAEKYVPDSDQQAGILAAWAQRDSAVADQIVPKVVALLKADAGAGASGGDVLAVLPVDERQQAADALVPLLKEADEGVKMRAADALGKVGMKSAVPALRDAMKDTAGVRRVAIGAIALIADPSGEPELVEAIENQNDDNEARAQAAAGLGRIGTPQALTVLIKTLSDDDLKVQMAAVSALARAGKPALPELETVLRTGSDEQRARAAQALAGVADPQANAALIAALNDPAHPKARAEAATALGFAGNGGAVSALVGHLNDSDGLVADASARALASIGPAATPALAQALESPDASKAYQAARALGMQGPEALQHVVAAGSRSPVAARWAIISLRSIGGPKAVAALQSYARSHDPDTRDDARLALKQLGVI